MKRSVLYLAALAVCFAACQHKTAEDKGNSLATLPDTSNSSSKICYAYRNGKDTVTLSYTTAGNAIAGKLNFNYFGKDRNTGTIAGTVKGDTILADYTFSSEGKNSVRQVAFLKKGDLLLEGYGDTEEKGGKIAFKNVSGLKYVDALSLKVVPCK